LGDALEALGAQAQRVDALLIRDVLEDRRRRSVEVTRLTIGIGRRDADRKPPRYCRDQTLGACRTDLMHHGALERLRQLRGDLADARQHRLANAPAEAGA